MKASSPLKESRAGGEADRALGARLLGLGTATPAMAIDQTQMTETMIDLWRLKSGDEARFRRIVAGTGIRRRYVACAPQEAIHLGTEARMHAYERLAPPLAERAARRALAAAEVPPERVTDLIVVSCTGYAAPGLDVALVSRLGLSPAVRRAMIGFMGCYGGIIGLRTAADACIGRPGRVALMVSAELCSLHVRDDPAIDNLVASALFADGAAAAVVAAGGIGGAGHGAGRGWLCDSTSLLIEAPSGQELMSWRITDAGFAMTLDRSVPALIREALTRLSIEMGDCPTYIVHPGGPDILDAADEALGLSGQAGLPAARRILNDFGNMSSATVLHVLAEAMHTGCPLPAQIMAFGPGLAIESVKLDASPCSQGD